LTELVWAQEKTIIKWQAQEADVAKFIYVAVEPTGNQIKGVIEGRDKTDVTRTLKTGPYRQRSKTGLEKHGNIVWW